MRVVLVAVTGLLVTAGVAEAQSYRSIASAGGRVIFVEDPIVERRETLAYANAVAVHGGGNVAYQTMAVRIDCDGNEFAMSRQAALSADGSVLQRSDAETEMVYAPPDSPMGKVISFACWRQAPEGSTLYPNLAETLAAGRRILAAH